MKTEILKILFLYFLASLERFLSKAFNKKFKAGIGKDFKEQNKQKVFLQNRGFSFEEIDSVFS